MTPEFLAFIEDLPDAILITDAEGNIIAVNLELQSLFKYEHRDLIENQVEILIPKQNREKHIQHRHNYKQDPIARPMGIGLILEGEKKDGTIFPVQISLKPLKVNNQFCLMAVIRDMSEYQKLERKLLNSERELRIALESKLDEAEKQLIEAENMASLGGMVAGMTHEINTPLGVCFTSISFALGLLAELEKTFKGDNLTKPILQGFIENSKESLDITSINLSRAIDLIKSFKTVAIDQASGDQREFDVKEYIAEVIMSMRPKLKKSSHQVITQCADNLVINSFPGAFAQILVNLIDNSLIHGFEDTTSGTIKITVSVKNNLLLLCYQDDGQGVAEHILDKIFEPFITSKRGKGSSGLGMNIVYSLVTKILNGEIKCISKPGQGVTFNIEIPYAVETHSKSNS